MITKAATEFHTRSLIAQFGKTSNQVDTDVQFTYTFENFFHPFVGELIRQLNQKSLPGLLDPIFLEGLSQKVQNPPATNTFFTYFKAYYAQTKDLVVLEGSPKEIDTSDEGPYAGYNWELFFHIPLTIAVHLSKNQRFAESQRWFHYIFDPTVNDPGLQSNERYWKFIAFRNAEDKKTIAEIIRILSTPRSDLNLKDQKTQDTIFKGYQESLYKPFRPHAIARTRHLAYQYLVVMKYLDNLIAWGDHLFQQDTLESINEATQIYVLAANILGERPQQAPPVGKVQPKTFAQLKKQGAGRIGDFLVDLQSQIPFNLAAPKLGAGGSPANGNASPKANALFGIGRTLYFCVPPNEKMLSYWDTVADRLFKIRHCMNIAGVVRPLALFDPPIDPGMLVKAVAAGLDISSIVNGLNQPIGPSRCLFLIQKALELCGEVRGLGNALLSALKEGDAEQLALIRQRHEIQIQQKTQDVRFLQWKLAQETTKSLLTSRATALERYHYYQSLLGLPDDPNAPDSLTITPALLTEENFDEAYAKLVGQYDKALALQKVSSLNLAGDTSPTIISGFSGSGKFYLSTNEDKELNVHLPVARDARVIASAASVVASSLMPIPSINIDGHFWGIGVHSKATSGEVLASIAKTVGDIAQLTASWEQDQAGMTSKAAGYERRAGDWLLQYNLAGHELMQIGRQILTSLIAEQTAQHEYEIVQQQIANSQEVDQFLHDKFTNQDLHLWMQGEISRLYYEYYRFAFDTARKAEKTMKQELMRPEVDAQDFVKFNYWDGGRKGLLSGEALYLDVKRMELAYHDNNKRELELTRHVSLRQINPVALLQLRTTAACQVTVPEWLYDLDGAGHYLRRIKTVSVTIPAVVGPYTSVNCTLTLLNSSVRKSAVAGDDYNRQGTEDDRFIDYPGGAQSIVTSSGQNDSGMFETNLHDERFLPFEGAGAVSTWKLDLPKGYSTFDYNTITDVILHIRYTARQGVIPDKVNTALGELFQEASQSNFKLLFSLRYEFPTEWAAFVNNKNNAPFAATVRKDTFPYFTQAVGKTITITGLDFHNMDVNPSQEQAGDPVTATTDLNKNQKFDLSHAEDVVLVRKPEAEVFLVVQYTVS